MTRDDNFFSGAADDLSRLLLVEDHYFDLARLN